MLNHSYVKYKIYSSKDDLLTLCVTVESTAKALCVSCRSAFEIFNRPLEAASDCDSDMNGHVSGGAKTSATSPVHDVLPPTLTL